MRTIGRVVRIGCTGIVALLVSVALVGARAAEARPVGQVVCCVSAPGADVGVSLDWSAGPQAVPDMWPPTDTIVSVTVTNLGRQTARGVEAVIYVGGVDPNTLPASCRPLDSIGSGPTVGCTVGVLAPPNFSFANFVTFTFHAWVKPTPVLRSYLIRATASAETPDPDTNNNSAVARLHL